MKDDYLTYELESTSEYKTWGKSLLAVIAYVIDKETNDEVLISDLMTDYLNASLQLGKGLEKIKNNTIENQTGFEEFQEENNELVFRSNSKI